MTDAYPLSWPEGWPRTAAHQRKAASFGRSERVYSNDRQHSWNSKRSLTVADAVARVQTELQRLGVVHGDMIVSSNLALRLDGLPRSGQGEPTDPGVAVYWQTRGKPMRVMAVDAYRRVADNLAAIAATLEAMRAIERHGGAQILDRAFTGFLALPAAGPSCWAVLGLEPGASEDAIEAAYRAKAKRAHPDTGGSHAAMSELNAARDEALRKVGAAA